MSIFKWMKELVFKQYKEPEVQVSNHDGKPLRRILVLEGTNSIQFVCPYCKQVQSETTGMNVLLSPPDYWTCENTKCGKVSTVLADTPLEGTKTTLL